ncbi:hypothetical protein IXO390_21185 [Xanthomonas oryzae pv. oryzae]|nr:hypothetical protein IXO390_21185 [Xanthomonas oryzae pv. oryzae]
MGKPKNPNDEATSAGDSPSPIRCNAIRRISSSAARDTKRPSLFFMDGWTADTGICSLIY